jgi:hypothetical protein
VLFCGTIGRAGDFIQVQQYYETLVTLRGGHTREGEGKRRKLRWWTWLIYSLYKNEYRNLKAAETTIRKGPTRMKKIRGDKPIEVITHTHTEVSQGNSLCSYLYLKQAKMSHFFFLSVLFFLL